MNFEYITKLAINVFNGENIKTMINQSISFVQKNHEYRLVVCKNIRGTEYVRMVHEKNIDLQDLYYRIKAINKDTILEVEEILDYSTKDKKK